MDPDEQYLTALDRDLVPRAYREQLLIDLFVRRDGVRQIDPPLRVRSGGGKPGEVVVYGAHTNDAGIGKLTRRDQGVVCQDAEPAFADQETWRTVPTYSESLSPRLNAAAACASLPSLLACIVIPQTSS
jgi:hypothetical protein